MAAIRRYKAKRTEKSIEKSMRTRVMKERGVIMFRKNASAGRYSDKAFPDRTLYAQFGFSMHVEVKREGLEASDDQAELHEIMRKAGHVVHVLDNPDDIIPCYRKEYLSWLERLSHEAKALAEYRKLLTLWNVRQPKSAAVSRSGKRAPTRS